MISFKKIMYRIIPDVMYLKIQYKRRMGKRLNLNNPETFNEKLQWLKLYDRKPEYTKMVDKYEVRKYIADTIGESYLIPLVGGKGVWDAFDNIDFDKLPDQFVLKCTHDSGSAIICKDKKEFDMVSARKKINNCLKRNFYYAGREWVYKNVKPRIIAEAYITDGLKDINDYKIMCFNGEPRCSFVCSERHSDDGLKVTFFDINWHIMPFIRHYPKSSEYIEKPFNYNQMLELSKILSKDIPFLRVDFYEIHKRLYIGELTFYPGNGTEEFSPLEWDRTLGDWMRLPISSIVSLKRKNI